MPYAQGKIEKHLNSNYNPYKNRSQWNFSVMCVSCIENYFPSVFNSKGIKILFIRNNIFAHHTRGAYTDNCIRYILEVFTLANKRERVLHCQYNLLHTHHRLQLTHTSVSRNGWWYPMEQYKHLYQTISLSSD